MKGGQARRGKAQIELSDDGGHARDGRDGHDARGHGGHGYGYREGKEEAQGEEPDGEPLCAGAAEEPHGEEEAEALPRGEEEREQPQPGEEVVEAGAEVRRDRQPP